MKLINKDLMKKVNIIARRMEKIGIFIYEINKEYLLKQIFENRLKEELKN